MKTTPRRIRQWTSCISLMGLFCTLGCTESASALDELDERYLEIMVDLAVADRDSSRNVRNSEARRRKTTGEKARVNFFHDKRVQKTIEEGRQAEAGSPDRIKADAYWQHLIVAQYWTEEEKAMETRLLGRLEEAASVEATWTSSDGISQIALDRSWSAVTRDADKLSEAEREDLLHQFLQHKMGLVNADLQALIELRNDVAQRAGFDNYWKLSLAGQGLTPEDVHEVVNELTMVVSPVHDVINQRIHQAAEEAGLAVTFSNTPTLRRMAGLDASRDTANAHFDTDLAEERVITAFQDMGIDTTGWQVYSGPRRYVRAGVYGFPVRPPDHVAIVMSQDRRWSIWQYEAMAHEAGHAVWWRSLDKESAASPVFWEPPAPWFEGFAQFFERMVYEPAFTARYVPELPEEEREKLSNWRRSTFAESITDGIVSTLVEERLYEDPNNLEAVCRFAAETRERLTSSPKPPVTEDGMVYDDAFLSPILWNYAAYSQNYLFAYMTEAWLMAAVTEKVGEPVANQKVGPLLRSELIRVSHDISFPERLAAMMPGERSAALKEYVTIPQVPDENTDDEDGDTPDNADGSTP